MSPVAMTEELLKLQEFCDRLIRLNAALQEQVAKLTDEITDRNVKDLQKYNEDKKK